MQRVDCGVQHNIVDCWCAHLSATHLHVRCSDTVMTASRYRSTHPHPHLMFECYSSIVVVVVVQPVHAPGPIVDGHSSISKRLPPRDTGNENKEKND